jgi:D-glycero-D-manno-heptose 1,7-bisphosphate phosphatase
VLTDKEAGEWIRECQSAGLRVGYTCGAFDILHVGHVDYLEKARALCDRLIVAINSDRSIRAYKSALRPFNDESERMKLVAALRCVDAVTLLDEPRPVLQLQRWQPTLYIKGGDYTVSQLRSAEVVKMYGGEVRLIPTVHSTSTTSLVERILAVERHEHPEKVNRQRRSIVFLDRDGTLIPDVGYLSDPEKVELLPGVGDGLALLQKHGFRLVVVTNQQGIGLGYYSESDFVKVNQSLFRLLEPFGVRIDRILFCPHSLADACDCRKPGPLLLRRAMEYYDVSPADCHMIGDRISDIEAGRNAGCNSILLSRVCAPQQDIACAATLLDVATTIVAGVSERTSAC